MQTSIKNLRDFSRPEVERVQAKKGIRRLQRPHLPIRCQQRGIREKDISVAIRHGRKVRWFHDAILYWLGRRELVAALVAEPVLRYEVDRMVGIAVLVNGSSGKLITAFKERGGLRKISRNYRGLRRK